MECDVILAAAQIKASRKKLIKCLYGVAQSEQASLNQISLCFLLNMMLILSAPMKNIILNTAY